MSTEGKQLITKPSARALNSLHNHIQQIIEKYQKIPATAGPFIDPEDPNGMKTYEKFITKQSSLQLQNPHENVLWRILKLVEMQRAIWFFRGHYGQFEKEANAHYGLVLMLDVENIGMKFPRLFKKQLISYFPPDQVAYGRVQAFGRTRVRRIWVGQAVWEQLPLKVEKDLWWKVKKAKDLSVWDDCCLAIQTDEMKDWMNRTLHLKEEIDEMIKNQENQENEHQGWLV